MYMHDREPIVSMLVVNKRHPPQRVTEHSGGRDRSN